MNPFALANDKDGKVKLMVDKKMYDAKSLTFHPMKNDALTEIATEDFKKFITAIGKTAVVIDFQKLKKEVEDEAGKKEEEKKQPAKKQQPAGKKKEGKKAADAEEDEE